MGVGSCFEVAIQIKKAKNLLIMAGALCDEVQFSAKTLLDYVADIALKTGAPVAATGTTIVGLKERNVKRAKKMYAAELVNYMRYSWQDSVSDSKPEWVVLIGYNVAMARSLISAMRDAKTIFLSNVYLEEATYSLPNEPSLQGWQKNLEQIVQAL